MALRRPLELKQVVGVAITLDLVRELLLADFAGGLVENVVDRAIVLVLL